MSDTDIRKIFEEAKKMAEMELETPLRQLTRKILNEERKYLYSDEKPAQRKKNIKNFIEDARNSGNFNTFTEV
ncbi:hypothetical protein ACBQ04_12720 [Psychrobacter faecalis]